MFAKMRRKDKEMRFNARYSSISTGWGGWGGRGVLAERRSRESGKSELLDGLKEMHTLKANHFHRVNARFIECHSKM